VVEARGVDGITRAEAEGWAGVPKRPRMSSTVDFFCCDDASGAAGVGPLEEPNISARRSWLD